LWVVARMMLASRSRPVAGKLSGFKVFMEVNTVCV
jgi:hypothetical protein